MKNLLKIAFNLPLYSTYDYISQVTNSDIKIGMRVESAFWTKKNNRNHKRNN